MEATDSQDTHFYVHSFAIGPDGRLRLLEPEWISVAGQSPEERYAFTIGHAPSDSGRNASSAGVVPISL